MNFLWVFIGGGIGSVLRYAVGLCIGAVGGFVAGIALFGESASALRIASAALIVAGIVGLKLTAK